MYQNLPDNAMELVADKSEQIEYVVCLNSMKDMLSGMPTTQPFCMITSQKVYVYRRLKGDVEVKTCTLDEVRDVQTSTSRQPKNLLYMLWSLPCIALFFIMKEATFYAISQGVGFVTILPIVFWAIIDFAALVGAVAIIFSAIVQFFRKNHAVMQIITKKGESMRVDLPGKSTAEIESFKKELKRVRAAQKAKNAEVFW